MISLHIDVHDVNQELHERFWKWVGQIKSQLFSGVAGTCTFILFSDVYKRYTYEGPAPPFLIPCCYVNTCNKFINCT